MGEVFRGRGLCAPPGRCAPPILTMMRTHCVGLRGAAAGVCAGHLRRRRRRPRGDLGRGGCGAFLARCSWPASGPWHAGAHRERWWAGHRCPVSYSGFRCPAGCPWRWWRWRGWAGISTVVNDVNMLLQSMAPEALRAGVVSLLLIQQRLTPSAASSPASPRPGWARYPWCWKGVVLAGFVGLLFFVAAQAAGR